MPESTDLPKNILDIALDLATKQSWQQLRLHDIAAELELSLDQIHQHYRQKDDLVEAWYDRADSAMLQATSDPEFIKLDMPARLHRLIMTWLDALAKHKQVSRDMLWYKLEPGHIHLQLLGVLRVSRTVQWLREAAQQDSIRLQRILEEIGLTSIYLLTFGYWLFDHSDNQQRTREFLRRKLARAKPCAKFVKHWLGQSPASPSDPTKMSATPSS